MKDSMVIPFFLPCRRFFIFLSAMIPAAFVIAAGMLWAQSPIIAPNAKVELLADGFEFTEGPASDSEGNVYFTDQPNNRILVWNIDGTL